MKQGFLHSLQSTQHIRLNAEAVRIQLSFIKPVIKGLHIHFKIMALFSVILFGFKNIVTFHKMLLIK